MLETSLLYGGKVRLVYDSAKHAYYEGGKKIDGVTSATGKIDKSGPLIYWAVNKCALPYVFGSVKLKVDGKIKPGIIYDEMQLDEIAKEAALQHNKKKSAAGSVGTLIHDWCEKWIKADINKKRKAGTPIIYHGYNDYPEMPINQQMINGVEAFMDFVKQHDIQFKESERKVFSRNYRFAGTMDFEAIIDGELCVGDLKTSNHIVTEYHYQTAAYQGARMEETGQKYAARWILRVSKELTVKEDGTEGIEFEARRLDQKDFDEDYKTFLAALQILRREKILNPPKYNY